MRQGHNAARWEGLRGVPVTAGTIGISVFDALREDVSDAPDYYPPTMEERWQWLAFEDPDHVLFGYGCPWFLVEMSAPCHSWTWARLSPRDTTMLIAPAWRMTGRVDGVRVIDGQTERRAHAEFAGKRWAEIVDANQRADMDDFFLFSGLGTESLWPFSDADALEMAAIDVDNSLTEFMEPLRGATGEERGTLAALVTASARTRWAELQDGPATVPHRRPS